MTGAVVVFRWSEQASKGKSRWWTENTMQYHDGAQTGMVHVLAASCKVPFSLLRKGGKRYFTPVAEMVEEMPRLAYDRSFSAIGRDLPSALARELPAARARRQARFR